jgi:hypothetical protein
MSGRFTWLARRASTRRRHAAVHELYGKGVGISRIADRLDLDRKTVRRYAHAATADQMIRAAVRGPRRLAPYAGYLNQRWQEGCADSGRLHRELLRLGYQGSARTVPRWLEPWRSNDPPSSHRGDTHGGREVATWLTRHPDALTSEESQQLKQLIDCCPELSDTAQRVRDFAQIMDKLDGARLLPAWIDTVASEAAQPVIRNFARHLRQDYDTLGVRRLAATSRTRFLSNWKPVRPAICLLIDFRSVTRPSTTPELKVLVKPWITAGADRAGRIADLTGAHQRWPAYAPRAHKLGVGSMMGFLLFTDEQDLGALNLYSRKPGAFTEASELAGWLLASHAAIALNKPSPPATQSARP